MFDSRIFGLLRSVLILRDRRVALIDFGQSKELSTELRRRLCTFYLAVNSGNREYIAKTMIDLGIEIDVGSEKDFDKLVEIAPMYANGLWDTAPLPDGVDINPFSARNPIQQMPIRQFNSDLLMVLRTMGLLRALVETLEIDDPSCYMSTLFRPFATRGLRSTPQNRTKRHRSTAAVRVSLTTDVSSPFEPTNDSAGYENLCSMS